MSFNHSLERLKDALDNPPPGRKPGVCVIHPKDLRELLFHFERLDSDARQRHFDHGIALSEGRTDINIEKITKGDETVFRANIRGKDFDHHGEDVSPADALWHAATHWLREVHRK